MICPQVERIRRTEDYKFEAAVGINCTITNSALYRWTLSYRTSPTHLLNIERLGLEPVNDGILPMPRWTLPYGQYRIALRVSVPSRCYYRMVFGRVVVIVIFYVSLVVVVYATPFNQ